MAIKKSALYSTIWKGCDELRGGMEPSQYKDYVLVILFLKYISDKQKSDPDSLLSDIPEGCTFDDIVALKGKAGIGEALNTKLNLIAKSFGLGEGFFDGADFDNEEKLGKGKDLIDTVSNLIGVFQNPDLDFGNNRAADDDLIGDAYEYLMRNFAAKSGQSKGQFYTPAEASRLAAKLLDISNDKRKKITIYDMTCGSGSLLLRAAAESNADATFIYGQESILSTLHMAKMNMILHGMDGYADLRYGDTLNNPAHLGSGEHLEGFDYCVANPPFSLKAWLKSAHTKDVYGRWDATDENIGIPKGKADMAFFMHMVRSLAVDGKGACFLPHGVLFRKEEYVVRANFVKRHIIRGIIGLPANLFYGTPIAACIVVVDKKAASTSKGIYMIDAKEGFRKDGAKNRLREQDIRRVLDTWHEGKTVPHYARLVEWSELEENDYNLNISRYIAPRNTEPNQDLHAHLCGGIPQTDVDDLDYLWKSCPSLQQNIFTETDDAGYLALTPQAESDIEKVINSDTSYKEQYKRFENTAYEWRDLMEEQLENVKVGCLPKQLIDTWSSMTLNCFQSRASLVDAYDVYDALLNYWGETMQDDVYMISRDGWSVTLQLPRDKNGKFKKTYSYENISCDLLPVNILIEAEFRAEQKGIEHLREQISAYDVAMDELIEEFGSLFEQAVNDKDKVENKLVRKLLTQAKKKKGSYSKEEISAWSDYIKLLDKQDAAKKELKSAIADLTDKVVKRYDTLGEDDVRNLVFNNKWMNQLAQQLDGLMQTAQQGMMNALKDLTERYADPLPALESDVEAYRKAVADDLRSMGLSF